MIFQSVSTIRFACKVFHYSTRSKVLMYDIDDHDERSHPSIVFEETFPKKNSPPMRKAALICGMKMLHKPIYDVMHQ